MSVLRVVIHLEDKMERTKMYGYFGKTKSGDGDALLVLHTNKGDLVCAFQKIETADLLRPHIMAMGIKVELLEFEFKRVVEVL